MTADLKIVEFPVQVSLADIPGRLRQLADEYESGAFETPETFVFVQGYRSAEVRVNCFGDCPTKWEVVGLLHLAASRFDAEEGDTSRKGGS